MSGLAENHLRAIIFPGTMAVAAVISCIAEAAESSVTCLESTGAFIIVGRKCGAIDFMLGHRRECRLYTGIKERVVKLVPILGGLKFAALSANGLLTLWDVKSRELQHTLHLVEIERAFDMVLADENLYIAGHNRTVTKVTLEEAASRLVRGAVVYKDTKAALTCLATIDGARKMLVGTADGRVVSFNAESRSGGIQTMELPQKTVSPSKKRRKLHTGGSVAEALSASPQSNVFLAAAEHEAREAAAVAAYLEDRKYSESAVLAIASLDSRIAVATDVGGRIFILSVLTATIIQEHMQSVVAPIVAVYACSPSAFFTAALSGKVTHYCRSNSERRAWIPVSDRQTHVSDSTAVVMDSNDRLVVGGGDGYLRIYESVSDFDSYKQHGSITPMSLNTHFTRDNDRDPKLILEGVGTKTLMVWSILKCKSKALSRLTRRIALMAAENLTHPLCRRLDNNPSVLEQSADKWEVVKVAEIEFRHILEQSAVIMVEEGRRYTLFVQCSGGSSHRYWFDLDLESLSLKKHKFSGHRPHIAHQLKNVQVCGIWPNGVKGEAVVSVLRKEGNACSISLALMDVVNDSVQSLYTASEEPPITDLQIVKDLILRPSWHGCQLMRVRAGTVEKIGTLHPPNTMQSTVLILGEEFVLAVDFHRPLVSVYNIAQRRWILINQKYKVPEEYHTSLLISGGVSLAHRRFLLYSARSMIHITLGDEGLLSEVLVEEVGEMSDGEHIGGVCYFVRNKEADDEDIVVFSNEASNAEAFRPRVYGRA